MIPDTPTLLHIANTYGYPAVALLMLVASAGLPLPVGLLLVALGALSALHAGPSLLVLIGLGIVGAVAGDALDYLVGRLGMPRMVLRFLGKRRARAEAMAARVAALLRSKGGLFIFVTRFLITPLATPTSLLAGTAGISLGAFLVWDIAGETVYTLLNLGMGRLFGAAATTPALFAPGLAVVGCAVVAAAFLVPRLRQRWTQI